MVAFAGATTQTGKTMSATAAHTAVLTAQVHQLKAAIQQTQHAGGSFAQSGAFNPTSTHSMSTSIRQVTNDTRGFNDELTRSITVGDVTKFGLDKLKLGFEVVAAAIVGATVALADFFLHAYKTFAHMQTMQLSFTGFLGSPEKAKQMIDYIKAFAETSPFHMMDLSKTALELTQIGLSVNQWLPNIQNMALGIGRITPEGLEDIVEILRLIQGGATGRAFGPHGLGRFGISRLDLEGYGAKFSGGPKGGFDEVGNQFQGSREEALDIVSRAINDRFLKSAEQVATGAEVTLANLGDAVDKLEEQAGEAVAKSLTPAIKNLTRSLNDLTAADAWNGFSSAIAGVAGLDVSTDGLTGAFLILGQVVIDVAEGMKKQATGAKGFFDFVKERLDNSPLGWAHVGINWAIGKATGIDLNDDGKNPYMANTPGYDAEGAPQSAGDYWRTQVEKQLLENTKKREAGQGDKPLAPELDKKLAADKVVGDKQVSLLGEIAKNTQEHLKLDLRRYVLGGGDLARLGITPVERANLHKSGASETPRGNGVGTLASALERYIAEEVQRRVASSNAMGF